MSSGRQAAVRAHLAACPACRQELEALARLPAALSAWPEPATEADLAARLQARLAAPAARRVAWWPAAGVAAAAALALLMFVHGRPPVERSLSIPPAKAGATSAAPRPAPPAGKPAVTGSQLADTTGSAPAPVRRPSVQQEVRLALKAVEEPKRGQVTANRIASAAVAGRPATGGRVVLAEREPPPAEPPGPTLTAARPAPSSAGAAAPTFGGGVASPGPPVRLEAGELERLVVDLLTETEGS